MKNLVNGTYVVVAGRLGIITRPARAGRAQGYNVQSLEIQPGDGTLPHFADEHMVHPAVVGENVCPEPKGTHWCGLVHTDERTLAKIPRPS